MASTLQSLTHFSPLLNLSNVSSHRPRKQTVHLSRNRRTHLRVTASGNIDLLGDFGARDPFPAEIESNFAEKVLGNVSTEHKILIPNAQALSLAKLDCVPAEEIQQPLSEDEVKKLLFKVVGWKIIDEGGCMKLQGVWKVKDMKCGEELINRIKKTVEYTGHLPTCHLEEPNIVKAELWTSSVGGLSINDFIVAAKIDGIKVSDLQPRLRVWA